MQLQRPVVAQSGSAVLDGTDEGDQSGILQELDLLHRRPRGLIALDDPDGELLYDLIGSSKPSSRVLGESAH